MRRFLAACSLLFVLPFPLRASGPTYVSEIAWAGSSASLADEWLELCGPPGADLSGWSIEGASANPIAIPAGTVVSASGAYLIANYADGDAKSILAVAPDFVTTSVALSNSALFITLRDAAGAIADVAGAPGAAPFAGTSGETKASMERVDASLGGDVPEAWASAVTSAGFDSGATGFGTPGACAIRVSDPVPETVPPEESSTSSPAVPETPPVADEPPAEPPRSTSAVRVSEIYPSPASGGREWIELVNPSNVGELLDDWTVEDAKGTKTALKGLLMPWARFIIEAPKGSLNNDGDLVMLKDAQGRVIDRVEYPKVSKGESFMRVEFQDAFVMTLTATPGVANVFMSTEKVVAEAASAASIVAVIESPGPVVRETRAESPAPAPRATTETRAASAPKPAPVPKKIAAKPKTTNASRYKGDAYAATIVVPPGVYSKTRAYIQRDGEIEELRLSKSPGAAWNVGDRVTFIAQEKSEGAVTFLLANPNSVRTVGSASATFATAEAWPEEAGGYSFTAEVASIRGDAIEVTLGGVEGDVLAPSGTISALKPGDTIRVEGFIAPGPRPRVVLPYPHALRLFEARLPEDAAPARTSRLPATLAIGLTVVAAAVGLAAYLRMQRLKRLALTQAPLEDGAWE